MNNIYEVKLAATVNGKKQSKRVTYTYLTDALSCTEAESRVIESTSELHKEPQVLSVKKYKVAEIFQIGAGDKWYKAKINYLETTVKGKDKKVAYIYLTCAASLDEARDNFHAGMKGTMSDWELDNIGETKIMDFIKYSK